MNRDEAMAALETLGVSANRRVWNLGDSICVKVLPRVTDGITSYAALTYLYEMDDGRWGVLDIHGRGQDHVCETLCAAVEWAAEMLLAEKRRLESAI